MDAFERTTGGAHPLASKMDQPNNEHRRKRKHSHLFPTARNTASVPLTNYYDTVWYGPITVGSPGHTFTGERPFRVAQPSKPITRCTVQFDTGSSDLFLPDVSCTTCQGHELYDPQKSSTAQNIGNTANFSFGDQSWAFVEQYKDTVTLAGYTVSGILLICADGQLTIPIL